MRGPGALAHADDRHLAGLDQGDVQVRVLGRQQSPATSQPAEPPPSTATVHSRSFTTRSVTNVMLRWCHRWTALHQAPCRCARLWLTERRGASASLLDPMKKGPDEAGPQVMPAATKRSRLQACSSRRGDPQAASPTSLRTCRRAPIDEPATLLGHGPDLVLVAHLGAHVLVGHVDGVEAQEPQVLVPCCSPGSGQTGHRARRTSAAPLPHHQSSPPGTCRASCRPSAR